MREERRLLQQSLALTRREWSTFQYLSYSQNQGLSKSIDRPMSLEQPVKPQSYLRTWKTRRGEKHSTPAIIDFNASYKRVMTTARSSRTRKVSDAGWRSALNTSPTKYQQSESRIDLTTASVTQYLQWHRSHPAPHSETHPTSTNLPV